MTAVHAIPADPTVEAEHVVLEVTEPAVADLLATPSVDEIDGCPCN